MAAPPSASAAQSPGGAVGQLGDTLTLRDALRLARASHAGLRAAREAVAAARGRERQAGGWSNPAFTFAREQTSATGAENHQDIATLDMPLDFAGRRAARATVERRAREALELHVQEADADFAVEVVRAFAQAIAAEQRVRLARSTADAFAFARRVSDARLAAGDIAGSAARRVRLEAARYAALLADAIMGRASAHAALGALLPEAGPWHAGAPLDVRALGQALATTDTGRTEELQRRAVAQRASVRLAEVSAAMADAQRALAQRERVPVPVVSLGYKWEGSLAPATPRLELSGFVAGFSVPLALFDRQAGTVEAATADQRRLLALRDGVRTQIRREVADALAGARAVDEQVTLLRPLVEVDAPAALKAVQASYDEGDISLLEWLDTVRAFVETETRFVTLVAEQSIRRAVLARALGNPILPASVSAP